MPETNYIITSGWWCDNDSSDDREKKLGASALRNVEFFPEWYRSIVENCSPAKILVVDSASPIKPKEETFEKVHFLSLDRNPGHPTKHFGLYSGVTYAHVIGMIYAMLEGFEYWVYIEQDVLIAGKGIVEYAISFMKKDIMFGSGVGTPQPMQQSFMIMKTSAIPDFIRKLHRIGYRDNSVSPEMKFSIAASPLLNKFPDKLCHFLLAKNLSGRLVKRLFDTVSVGRFKGYTDLPFGYGRSRPIDFSDEYFYFQHGTEKELSRYREKCCWSQ